MSSVSAKSRLVRFAVASLAAVAMVATMSGTATAATAKRTYVLLSTKGAHSRLADTARNLGGNIKTNFTGAIQGFTADLSASAAAALSSSAGVTSIEPEQVVTLADTQSGATWGIDRIDQSALPLNGTYNYPTNAGLGTRIYVIDTGVRATHTEIAGRVLAGYNALDTSNPLLDCNGHGTHVAGTAAGTTYGVAKLANIVPVKVLDCAGSGTLTAVVNGINWAVSNRTAAGNPPSVISMSLGASFSSTVNNAVATAVNAGITTVVAAGNSSADACNSSPASAPSAITVGATTSADAQASYSNFGTCVDIYAPGSSITSSWGTGDTALNTISGTSMATPHVSGAAAVYLSANRSATPAQVVSALTTNSTANVITSIGTGSPNKLLNVSFLSGATITPPSASAPSTPAAPRLTGATPSSLTVSWSAPFDGGSAITGYVLEYKALADANYTALPSTTSLSATVSGLSEANTYVFRVSATNSVGTSAASATLTSATLSNALAAPTGVRAVVSTSTTAVSWTAVNPITYGVSVTYQVAVYRNGVLLTGYPKATSTTSITLNNLPKRTALTVGVKAVSATTVSGESTQVAFTTR